MTVLQVEGIFKQYAADPSFYLKVKELGVKSGELLALLGPSGCGKTSFLKVIAGLLRPDQGDIYYKGERITNLIAEKRGFGMVFQQPLLFPHMTVEENVAFGLKMKGLPKPVRLEKARQLLFRVGLNGYEQRYPKELSGGQQQRVSLARSLLIEPRILLMDEPFSALDPELRSDMRNWLKQIHKETGTTILLVTHDLEEAFFLADRIGVMVKGELLQVDYPENLYRRPIDPEVAKVIGLTNIICGEIQDGFFSGIGFRIPFAAGNQAGWLSMDPHSLQLVQEHEAAIEGFVKDIHFSQGCYRLKVQVGSTQFEMVQPAERGVDLKPGNQVKFICKQEGLHFIPTGKKGVHHC